MFNQSQKTTLLDQLPGCESFLDDVVLGLRAFPKKLPCKYFYDSRGSQLFDQICQLDEYYLTRTEMSIMQPYAPEMAEQIGPGVMLIEYGSGSSVKTRILLDHLLDPVSYVPVDISPQCLQEAADRLSLAYPHIEVLPVCADFTEVFDLPMSQQTPTHNAVYFPGSTIGNFQPEAAIEMLSRIAPLCGTGGGLLIGIDLHKDTPTIEAAYNDATGVTAEFNLNLLRRINRELGGDFDLDQFEHFASYNVEDGRVEIYLVSRRDQRVTIGDESFDIDEDETICTEYSHKYTIEGFATMAAYADLTLRRAWTDDKRRFAVLHFAVLD